MKVIICLDDKLGMAFNKRRQSRDSEVIKDICKRLGKESLFAEEYSNMLFDGSGVNILPLEKAENKDSTLFLERIDPEKYSSDIDALVIYRWNRHYPSDLKCTIDMNAFALSESLEFVGSSHERITREVWKRKQKSKM